MRGLHRSDHNGAKKAKGFWGRKEEAKRVSKKQRRLNSKYLISESSGSVVTEK